MTDQRFPAGPEQRVRLSRIDGELLVDVWDDDSIRVLTDGRVRELYQEGDDLVIDGCDDDIQLRVPARVRVFINGCNDDVRVQGVRRVTELIAAEPRVSATALQTVGSKGYDGLAIALVLPDS